MPVLLLARGDKEGRDLLRKAIEARYGLGAPAIETLRIQFEGRARTKLGPITTWVSLEAAIYFGFPGRARWAFNMRAVGVPVRAGINAFDGNVYRKRGSSGDTEVITNPDHVRAARLRMWTAAGMLLTPLAEQFFELKATGERSFEATNTDTKDSIHVTLNEDYTVDTVSTTCLNPDQNYAEQLFTFQAHDGQIEVNELMVPGKITILWNNSAEYEVKPAAVEINPPLDETVFTLETDPQQ